MKQTLNKYWTNTYPKQGDRIKRNGDLNECIEDEGTHKL